MFVKKYFSIIKLFSFPILLATLTLFTILNLLGLFCWILEFVLNLFQSKKTSEMVESEDDEEKEEEEEEEEEEEQEQEEEVNGYNFHIT